MTTIFAKAGIDEIQRLRPGWDRESCVQFLTEVHEEAQSKLDDMLGEMLMGLLAEHEMGGAASFDPDDDWHCYNGEGQEALALL
ncbi:MAG: hypothetical protein RJQ08_01595 [Salinisphaeraceae bacterium]|uniref:hypothetical protein n=1 Tax=Marinobacter salarius TaxID=1420917 RepID=UPI0032EBB488